MRCKQIGPMLSAYLDGELDPGRRAEVDTHVAACPECARLLHAYRALGQDLRGMPPVQPPSTMQKEFAQRRRRLDASPLSGARLLGLSRGLSSIAFVAALVALALGAYLILQRTQPVEQRVGLASTFPEDQATDVPLDANLELVFAQPMDRASVETATRISPRSQLAFAWEEHTLTIVPFVGWRPSTAYTLTVTTTARRPDGTPLSEPIMLRFTTTDEGPQGSINPLGRFGVLWRAQLGGPEGPLGYAIDVSQELWSAVQPFERGLMLWLDRLQGDHVYVLTYDGADEWSGTWQGYIDTFRDGDTESIGLAPPPGLLEPIRGFGRVWREELGGAEADLGWAVAREQGYTGETQPFERGLMVWNAWDNIVYVLWDDGTWEAFPAE